MKKKAFQLILLLGIISLMGDIIYEGARSVNGQYLNILGISAVKVGFFMGLGEFLGYFFRLLSGYFADRTKSYWFFTIFGYSLLISIPLIALTGVWQIVAFLVILERIGKGIRTPARDTIASHAGKQIGTGWAFGIAEFIDQIGAVIGPLVFALVFIGVSKNSNFQIIEAYKKGYSLFLIPFILLMFFLFFTYIKFKDSERLESSVVKEKKDISLSKKFWLYVLFVFITTMGFVHFALIGFHLKKTGSVSDMYIPVLYSFAMIIDAIAGLFIGKVYDRLKNQKTVSKYNEYYLLLFIPFFAMFIPLFVFSNSTIFVFLGILLFGFGLGAQETIMKAIVADMTPLKRRSSGYGVFNLSFGLAFFTGSVIAGYLYDYSVQFLILGLAFIEFLAIPVLYAIIKTSRKYS